MASPSPLASPAENQKLHINAIKMLVSIINGHIRSILQDPETRESLKQKCTSKLEIQSREFFEFSEHSVLSNLYWGIENADSAYRALDTDEKTTKLDNSEGMLQIPASLDENSSTMGISNGYLVSCSYFYLSVVEFARGNDWRVAMHFLQAVLICPRSVRMEFAPGIRKRLLPIFIRHKFEKKILCNLDYDDDDDGIVDDMMRWMAKMYKPWLVYYQIVSRGEFENRETKILSGDDEAEYAVKRVARRPESVESRSSYDDQSGFPSRRNIYAEGTICSSTIGKIDRKDHEAAAPNHHGSLSSTKLAKSSSQPLLQAETDQTEAIKGFSRDFPTSFYETNKSALAIMKPNRRSPTLNDYIYEQENPHTGSISLKKHKNSLTIHQSRLEEVEQQNGLLEKLVSKLCFSNGDDDNMIEVKSIYEMLESKPGLKYSLLKDIILDQLLIAISTSKEDRIVRTSLAILSTIVIQNRAAIDEIKRKGLRLYDLATALKRNVHEAVVLIYLINPSPAEIRTLELLPCLVEVVCARWKPDPAPPLVTPPSASLMIIEVLVTAFDGETKGAHLAAISSPRVLSGLVRVPRGGNPEELVSLAAVLVECMRFDGECRKYVAEFAPVASLVSLLWRNERRATHVALEFFNELLRMPRSSATGLLEEMGKQGSMNNLCALLLLTQKNSDPEYTLLAANLLLQLQVIENASGKRLHREEAAQAIVDSLAQEDCPATGALSAFILSNLGGTYSWTGDSYTAAWLVKKTGLTSAHHRNLIKNLDFHDPCLQDGGIDSWCSKVAQCILRLGSPIFHALKKGLTSDSKRVSRDSLVAATWLGCELVKGPDELRHSACDILLQTIEQYMHPGSELEERLLACLCIYNYTSGKGMKKIISISEGLRQSLRRLSNVTWMAEELLKVADYFQPDKWRISCVHSQILEAGNKNSGPVTALVYYKGELHSGHGDGSIKVWDIKGQTANLVRETREHKKAVTCFSLYEPGDCLLSGSNDKTIKIWRVIRRNLECVEVIQTKESVRNIDTCGELIFATTQSHKLKVIDKSRKAKDLFKNKRVKCLRVSQGKVYGGCMDSSIQELMIINNRQQEMKSPSKSWLQSKPINSVVLYKDWLYSASSVVEGSKIKEWRRSKRPQMSIMPEKGSSVIAMEVLEDFIYLNCSTSMSSLQIWLRGTQQKVGRLSAGSNITSLLSANDIILCGTEKGLIKGWIPI